MPIGGVIISDVTILTAEIRGGTGKLIKFLAGRNLGDNIDIEGFLEKERKIYTSSELQLVRLADLSIAQGTLVHACVLDTSRLNSMEKINVGKTLTDMTNYFLYK